MIDLALTHKLPGLDLDVAFTAPTGVTSIFGPSGAGKTSILRAVAGLSSPTTLALTLDDTDLAAIPVRRRRIGYVFQDARLFPHMSVQQNLRYGGRHDEARIIDMLGLSDILTRKPRHLSGGEAQRVAIGRALMSNPRLLLLDEPLSSLDAARKATILPYLERLRDEARLPILHVSHDLAEVTRLADTLVVISEGKVVQSGPLPDVLRAPQVADHLGPRQRGTVISARVEHHDPEDDLTQIVCDAGTVLVPGQVGPEQATIRLRILAHDIILTRQVPTDVSALNVLPVKVHDVTPTEGGIDVTLDWNGTHLLARVTRRSARTMTLAAGLRLFAMVKASAVGAG